MRVGDIQLDRRITLDPNETAPTDSYSYGSRQVFDTAVGFSGRYFIETDGTRLVLHPRDADGADLPDFAVGDVLTLTWADNAYSVSVTLTGVTTRSVGFGGQTQAPDLAFDAPANWDFALVVAGGDMTLAVGGGDVVGPRKVWARRQDFTGRDSLISSDDRSFALSRSRFVVRAGANVAIGDQFLDDLGDLRTIEGIAQIGRGRYIELLGKTFSTEPGG